MLAVLLAVANPMKVVSFFIPAMKQRLFGVLSKHFFRWKSLTDSVKNIIEIVNVNAWKSPSHFMANNLSIAKKKQNDNHKIPL